MQLIRFIDKSEFSCITPDISWWSTHSCLSDFYKCDYDGYIMVITISDATFNKWKTEGKYTNDNQTNCMSKSTGVDGIRVSITKNDLESSMVYADIYHVDTYKKYLKLCKKHDISMYDGDKKETSFIWTLD